MDKEQNFPIRILQCGLTNHYGGVESIIMNVYRKIDKNKIQFDFLTTHNGKIICEEEIKRMGGRIFKIEYSKKENPILHYKCLKKFFKKHHNEFQGVHMNRCFPNYSLPLKYAKKYNIPIRIFHSHNSNDMYPFNSIIKKIMIKVNKNLIKKRANILLACSKQAGKYMFGKSKFTIINNGIEISKFKYNESLRNKVRKNLDIEDKIVIGFVGRLQYQKNPLFAIKIMKKLQEEDNNKYILLMIGSGEDEYELKKYVKINNLNKKILFLGHRSDVNELYHAMDIFILPSKFEGLGMVLIEAQTSGVMCLASKNVPPEVKVTDRIKFLDIEKDVDIWCDEIKKISNKKISRNEIYKFVKKNKYNIEYTVSTLENIYLNRRK
ncbi:MAG: glycosyltransferase [Erysipelotrichaceae bacterium]|nr:glycosyltransferase [Erysipelotrichaceae bacterium]